MDSPFSSKPTKDQHWLPRFYLKEFTFKGKLLHVYSSAYQEYWIRSYDQICQGKWLHETERDDGLGVGINRFVEVNRVESTLEKFETYVASHYHSMLSACKEKRFEGDAFELGRKALCVIAGNFYTRHPRYLSAIRKSALSVASRRPFESFSPEQQENEFDPAYGKDNYRALLKAHALQSAMIPTPPESPSGIESLSFSISRKLMVCDFHIVTAAAGCEFITTDIPFWTDDTSIAWDDFSTCLFPISPKYLAVFTHGEPADCPRILSPRFVAEVNTQLLTWMDGWEYAISRGEQSLRYAIEHAELLTGTGLPSAR